MDPNNEIQKREKELTLLLEQEKIKDENRSQINQYQEPPVEAKLERLFGGNKKVNNEKYDLNQKLKDTNTQYGQTLIQQPYKGKFQQTKSLFSEGSPMKRGLQNYLYTQENQIKNVQELQSASLPRKDVQRKKDRIKSRVQNLYTSKVQLESQEKDIYSPSIDPQSSHNAGDIETQRYTNSNFGTSQYLKGDSRSHSRQQSATHSNVYKISKYSIQNQNRDEFADYVQNTEEDENEQKSEFSTKNDE